AVIATREWWQLRHFAVLPLEPAADAPSRSACGKEWPAGECFTQGIHLGEFGDTDDQAVVVLDWPGHSAVWSSECAQGNLFSLCPKQSVGKFFAGQARRTSYPAAIVDAVCSTCNSA